MRRRRCRSNVLVCSSFTSIARTDLSIVATIEVDSMSSDLGTEPRISERGNKVWQSRLTLRPSRKCRAVSRRECAPASSTRLPRWNMNEELLAMAETWRKTAMERLQKCEPASRSAMANAMLLACAEMLEWRLRRATIISAHDRRP